MFLIKTIYIQFNKDKIKSNLIHLYAISFSNNPFIVFFYQDNYILILPSLCGIHLFLLYLIKLK